MTRCARIGSRPFVPRSDEDDECAGNAVLETGRSVWTGISDAVIEGWLAGAEGCGSVPSAGNRWASGAVRDGTARNGVRMMSPGEGYDVPDGGWYDREPNQPAKVICQLRGECQWKNL